MRQTIKNLPKKILWVAAIVIICGVAIALIFPKLQSRQESGQGVKINKLGSAAFGHLGNLTGQENALSAAESGQKSSFAEEDSSIAAPTPSPVPLGNSAGTGVSGVTATDGEGRSEMKIAPPGVAFPYQQVIYKYVYQGAEVKLENEQVDVLKKIKDAGQNFSAEIFQNLSMGLLNASKFQNLKVRYFNIFEDADKGYEITVNPADGSISISMNWDKWREAMSCPETGCAELSAPADEEVIGIANRFLSDYGIDAGVYGQPVVDNNWRLYAVRSEDEASVSVPRQISVIYPLEINGQTVYEQGGGLSGMTVTVDIRLKKAVSAYGISAQNYQSSAYEAEKDFARILKFAERGGAYEYPVLYGAEGEQEVEIKEIELGEPRFGYVKQWNYTAGGESEELIIPALIFSIVKMPDSAEIYYYYSRQNVIIPIVKEILDQAEAARNEASSPPPPDAIMIKPLSEPAVPVSDILPVERK